MSTPPDFSLFAREALALNGIEFRPNDLAGTAENLAALASHFANFKDLAVTDADEMAVRFQADPGAFAE